MQGMIVKTISGFYDVDTGDAIYTCRARGVFRNEGLVPLTGDRVEITQTSEHAGTIISVLPRKNQLIRPPLANLDQLLIVVSTTDPPPNYFVIDKIIAYAELAEIEPMLVVSKTDLKDGAALEQLYKKAGFSVFHTCAQQTSGLEDLRVAFTGKISALAGNSGVGKSTLLNALFPKLCLQTGETSKKLGRGRHTTRHVQLYRADEGYIADTPGFSSFEEEAQQPIRRENLQFYFREFAPYLTGCKFTSCSHTKEKGCKIIEAVNQGNIAVSRFESYKKMYELASQTPDWVFDKKQR